MEFSRYNAIEYKIVFSLPLGLGVKFCLGPVPVGSELEAIYSLFGAYFLLINCLKIEKIT